MTKLRCPACKSILLGKAGEDEWECNVCGFSGYSKDFIINHEKTLKKKEFNPSLR
jgi:ribosomal protein L37AE/L43A